MARRMSAWRTPRPSRSATTAASPTSSTAYTCGVPAHCDARMYPHRAHWPIVVPETPTSSPTSPASRLPWPSGCVSQRLELALHRQPLERLGLDAAHLGGRHADALGGLAQRRRGAARAVDAVAQPDDL